MADILPQNFPIPSESAISSYSYSDISEGTGTVRYIVTRIQTDNSAANDDYILTTQSGVVSSEVAGEPKTVLAASKEFNFDVTFNTPKIVNGNIYGMIPFEVGATATTPSIRILKWNGSTETELVASTTFQATGTAGNYVVPFILPISNKKFKSGETLRVEMIVTSNTDAYLQHDPSGSISGSPTGGILSFFIPFKIQT